MNEYDADEQVEQSKRQQYINAPSRSKEIKLTKIFVVHLKIVYN